MKRILLANIGNRNLRYRGNFLNSDTFREETERLLKNFANEKQFLQAEILPVLFHHLGIDSISGMILFYSDTPPGDRNNQDTLYEASILQKLFSEAFPHVTVETKAVQCSVVDNNGLMQRYRGHLKKIKAEHPDAFFILCDAGGTAQQKAALKIMAEYLLDELQFETYTIKQDAHPPVEAIKSIEYRKVIDSEQIAALVTVFNYSGAMLIYNMNRHYASKQLFKGLFIAESLFAHNLNDAVTRCHPNTFGKAVSDYPVLAAIGNRSYYVQPPELASLQLPNAAFFSLAVLLDIAEAHRRTRSYGFYVLYNHIFMERLLAEIIEAVTGLDVDDRNNWQLLKQHIVNGTHFNGFVPPMGRSLSELFSATIPVKITLAAHLKIPAMQAILDSFTQLNSFLNQDAAAVKIDTLRNKFAHEGRTITEAHERSLIPHTKQWRTFFGLKEETIFDLLNRELQKLHYA